MATEPLARIKCDGCDRHLTKPKRKAPWLFEGATQDECEREASRAAAKAGWYVDGLRALCEACATDPDNYGSA